MTDFAEFQRLQWFSPAFPVGGYAYSHGIEKAIEAGDITNADSLAEWIADVLTLGAGRSDAILLGEAWRRASMSDIEARPARLADLAEFGVALGLSSERRLETMQQGAAFFSLIQAAWPHDHLPAFVAERLPYPVAVGVAGRVHDQPLLPLIAAYLQAFAANLIAAGLRLGIIGQSEAQIRMAALRPVILAVAAAAEHTGMDEIGGMAFRSDLMGIRHETQVTRLFRS